MKHILTILSLFIGIALSAQPNYKYILAHMPEFSDGEALYQLKEYQTWFPKQAHPYYLMANIHYRTYTKEHPLLNYRELSSALYDMVLYYGNCEYFIPNESIKKEWYQETAVNGKVTEETILAFVRSRRAEITALRGQVNELYNSYTQLVNRYDSCLQEMTYLAHRYSGEKEAQLLISDEDLLLVDGMSARASQLPNDIQRFKDALQRYPIEGYAPQFTFRPIDHFRMEGLTTTNFLQNDIQLWDFVRWADHFVNSHQNDVLPYLKDIENEYTRQEDAWERGGDIKVNKLLLNTIDHHDEGSAMSRFMTLQNYAVQAHALEQRIMSPDSVDADEWIILLQQHYRLLKLRQQSEELSRNLAISLNDPFLRRKYAHFISIFFPNQENWGTAAVERWKGDIEQRYQTTCERLVQLSSSHTPIVRVSEQIEAVIDNGKLWYQAYMPPVLDN